MDDEISEVLKELNEEEKLIFYDYLLEIVKMRGLALFRQA